MPRDHSPTDPLQHIDGHGEIALCILSAVNLSKLKSWEHLEKLCDLSVRSLDVLIDYQKYPVKAAENATRLAVHWALDSSDWHITLPNSVLNTTPGKHTKQCIC